MHKEEVWSRRLAGLLVFTVLCDFDSACNIFFLYDEFRVQATTFRTNMCIQTSLDHFIKSFFRLKIDCKI